MSKAEKKLKILADQTNLRDSVRPRSKKKSVDAKRESQLKSRGQSQVDPFRQEFENAFASAQDGIEDLGEGFSMRARAQRLRKWNSLLGDVAGQISKKADARFNGLLKAVDALRNWDDEPNAAHPLFSQLSHADDDVRTEAFRALSQLGGERIRERCLSCFQRGLQDPVPEVRRLMVRSIPAFARPTDPLSADVFQAAERALDDPAASVRSAAVRALLAFGVERVLKAINSLISMTEDLDPRVRRSTCELLGSLEIDALQALPSVIKIIANDADSEVRKAGWNALYKIDPRAKWVDLGPDDTELRAKFIQGLREVGEPARPFRRSLEARWRREMFPRSGMRDEGPPELRDVWNVLSQEEGELVRMAWLHRRADGLPKSQLFEFLGMGMRDERNDKLFRTRLTQIRGKLKKIGRETPIECAKGKIFWLSAAVR